MPDARPGSRRLWRVMRRVLIAAAVIVMLLAAAIGIYLARTSAQTEQAIAELRAKGQPTNAAELEQYYSLPDGVVDTAPLWLEAVRPLQAESYVTSSAHVPVVGDNKYAEVPPPGMAWPEQAVAEQHLEDYADSLQKMHEAARLDGAGRYPTDFSKGIRMQLPHTDALRAGCQLLILEAHVRQRQGDVHGAAESLHAVFQLGESLRFEPVLISQLKRFAIATAATSAIERLASHLPLSDGDLAVLQADLESIDYRAGLKRAILGEHVAGILAFENPATLVDDRLVSRLNVHTAFTRYEDEALYLDNLQRILTAADQPWPQALDEVEACTQMLDKRIRGTFLGHRRYFVTSLFFPATRATFLASARGETETRLVAAALAVVRFRRQHDRYPERLEELVSDLLPAVPTDPFDGQSLRYRAGDDEFTVYSVGKNRVDDGGQEIEKGEPDAVVTLRRTNSD